jgi:hypothetical protein
MSAAITVSLNPDEVQFLSDRVSVEVAELEKDMEFARKMRDEARTDMDTDIWERFLCERLDRISMLKQLRLKVS